MTRANDLYHCISYDKRRAICDFIHAFKCMCGRKYHLHVTEVLKDCYEDCLTVFDLDKLSQIDYLQFINDVYKMCEKHNIKNFTFSACGYADIFLY